MSAPIGNNYWTFVKNPGRPLKFKTPEELWEKAVEYFEYCTENPLKEEVFVGKEGRKESVNKLRAMTWEGLELFVGSDLKHYRTNAKYKRFHPVMSVIAKVIFTNKFEGAAAGLLNPAIIAKELGLAEKHEHTGKDGGVIETKLIVEMIESGPKPVNSEKDLDLD